MWKEDHERSDHRLIKDVLGNIHSRPADLLSEVLRGNLRHIFSPHDDYPYPGIFRYKLDFTSRLFWVEYKEQWRIVGKDDAWLESCAKDQYPCLPTTDSE
jgi:hypothetical protein